MEVLAVAATLVVCAASFAASWHGLGLLASTVGIPTGLTFVLPLSLDGLQLVASMVTLTRQRAGKPARWAWSIILLATGLSAAGNATAAPDNVLSRVVWGILPLLLAGAWHLLTGLVEDALSRAGTVVDTQDVPPTVAARVPPPPDTEPRAKQVRPRRDVPPRTATAEGGAADLAQVVRDTCDRLAAAGQQDIDWRAVVKVAPVLAGPDGYLRPDRSVPPRIAVWRKTRTRAPET